MQELTIEAGRTGREYWHDLWRYRELLYFLAWRDLLVRYKQTVIGIAWAIIRPFLTTIILTVVFSYFAKMPSGGVPYPILVFCGMLPWQFFSASLTESGNSLVGNAGLVSKVYFPRLVIPASSMIVSVVDFLISGCLLGVLLLFYRVPPSSNVLALPLPIVMLFATAFGSGLWVSALTVKYRDFRHIVPFMIQIGLYVSPVAYVSTIVPEQWRMAYSLNPMVGVIDGFRWAILGGEHGISWTRMALSGIVSVFLVVTGIFYFRKTERTFADVI